MPSRSEHAYESMREAVVTGVWPPGRRLVERDLAAELGVSRIPLREALLRLTAEGLVTTVPGRGTIVSPMTAESVADLFDLRESLEPLAARLAAERREAAGLERLRERLEEAAALDPERRVALIEANAAFHRGLVTASGNALLAEVMAPLETRVRRLFHLVERDPAHQCRAHAEQYEAVATGDAERAAALALDHASAGRGPALAAVRAHQGEAVDPLAATRTRRRRRAS